MPRQKLHASDAERLRAWREKKRLEQEDKAQQEREAQQAQRQRDEKTVKLHTIIRELLGKRIATDIAEKISIEKRIELPGYEWDNEIMHECKKYLRQIADALKSGSSYLPQ